MMRIALMTLAAIVSAGAVEVKVVAEEDVYTFTNPNNGSGPLWSYGCSPIARVGDRVFVAQMETGEGVPRLCNTRWKLLERGEGGWSVVAETPDFKQREPTVLTTDAARRLFLYVNPSIMPPGTEYGACEPHLLSFDINAAPLSPAKLAPSWIGTPTFTDHSYRGYAADANAGRILMFNIDAQTSVQHYCLLAMEGTVLSRGQVTFPVRGCYPQVALENGRGHILAVGDIVEPIEEWRAYKKEQTGQAWDYVFRRLFYASNKDIARDPFIEPIEIANVDATAGHISNQDLWVAPNGDAYIMYTESEVGSALMRDRFFPGKSTVPSLNLAIVRDGAIFGRHVLVARSDQEYVGHARFHVASTGEVYALAYVAGASPRNELLPIYPNVVPTRRIPVPFKTPFGSFLLASVRAGNAAGDTIDLIGVNGKGDTMAYGQVALK
ncbi:MAG: hypothetical protein HUU46_21665 [Candidatus Hydrogenedentes bacterium]|nr:hypothetical protein [Candidatus Hydrogenedentota bacterium]